MDIKSITETTETIMTTNGTDVKEYKFRVDIKSGESLTYVIDAEDYSRTLVNNDGSELSIELEWKLLRDIDWAFERGGMV